MALPGGAYPKTNKFAVALTDVPAEIQRKYMTRGTVKGPRTLPGLPAETAV